MRLATTGPDPEGPKRARALGVLRWFENRLASKEKGERDGRVYGYARHLGRYVNDGYLTRDEVCDAILAASRANGHMHGHQRDGWETNKSQAEIENDIARGLDVAARERTTVDWEARFDD